MDKQGLFSARRSEHARRLLSLKPIHFRQGQGGGRLCRYAKLLLIVCSRERTSARHNPEIGIMTVGLNRSAVGSDGGGLKKEAAQSARQRH